MAEPFRTIEECLKAAFMDICGFYGDKPHPQVFADFRRLSAKKAPASARKLLECIAEKPTDKGKKKS